MQYSKRFSAKFFINSIMLLSRVFELMGCAKHRRTSSPCSICGSHVALLLPATATPDFNPSILPGTLRKKFLTKENGYCIRCGFFQNYNRLSDDEIAKINDLGKDALTSEDRLSNDNAIHAIQTEFYDNYFKQRIHRWHDYFSSAPKLSVKNALFLRFWFGDAIEFAINHFSPDRIVGQDISAGCIRYTKAKFPQLLVPPGNVNGYLKGDFECLGPYDMVFSFHLLTHSPDPRKYLDTLTKMLAKNGVVVFSHEIEQKTTNPFHFNYFSEWSLVSLLNEYFSRV